MPDERLIQEIENILSDVVALGGQRERTSIVPNMLVRDASPTGQDDYVIIADNRDNDNILALKIPGIVYADNNLVNVIFPEGGEAIAFQQGSGSTTSGLWDIVPSTSTDIYYNKGNVGISTDSPDYSLQIGDGASSVALAAGENIQFIGPNTASGRLILEGTAQADIILIDGGAGADDKAMQLFTDGGLTKFRSFTDAAGVQSDNILVMDHGNGNVGLGDVAPDSKIVSSYNAWVGPAAVSGDTVQSSSYMEEGIVINSGAAKEMIALKDPAVAHGMTTNAETDTFGSMLVSTGFLGGLSIIGYSEDQLANTIIGRAASGSTTKGTSALAPVTLNAQKKSGTTVAAMGADENLVTISNGLVSPQTKWILDADGDSWQQGSITLGTNVIHDGDTDTYIGFTADDIEFFAGALSMLKLTEAGQDVVRLGPGSGDVDINFNGDMFLQGSTGRFGIGTITPQVTFHSVTGAGALPALSANTNLLFQDNNVAADNLGFTLLGGESGFCLINFADKDDENAGLIQYNHTLDVMNIRCGGFGFAITIDSGNLVGVGTTGPAAQLHADQPSTTAAIPTLSLDQADLSEEFINFISTIGAGNPIDTAAIGTYYGKIRVAVNGTFKYMALYNS